MGRAAGSRSGRPSAPVSEVQELRLAVGRLARRMRQLYAAEGSGGPSFTEVAVLNRLSRDGAATPTEIAGGERVTSQAITAVVRELERQQLVERAKDPQDGRRTIISITASGRAVLSDREHSVIANLLRALDKACTPEERRVLAEATAVLHRIADHL